MLRLLGMIVWIADSACEAMLREARARRRTETGGGLFGYATPDVIVVEQVGVAGGATRRRAASLVPDPDDLQAQIDRVISHSEGRRYLVGEWHTHPWGWPHLSVTDKRSLRTTAESTAIGLPRPLAIVLAPCTIPTATPRLGAYVWDPARRVAMEILPRSYSAQSPRGAD